MNNIIRRRGAFTLIEIMIVVFIISLFAVIVLPSFYEFGSAGSERDARMVASIIRYLNDTSQNTQSKLTLIVNVDNKTFSYPGRKGKETKIIGSLYSIRLSSSKEETKKSVTIHFDAGGLSEGLTVKLRGDSGFYDVIYKDRKSVV